MPANVIVLAFLPEEMAILRDRSAMEKKSVGEHIKVRLNLSGKF